MDCEFIYFTVNGIFVRQLYIINNEICSYDFNASLLDKFSSIIKLLLTIKNKIYFEQPLRWKQNDQRSRQHS